MHFNLSFAFDEMDKVMFEGLVWLTSECNNHSDYTVTRYMRDHFTCCVETTVRSSKEFVREFAFAYKQIGFTYQNLAANYGEIKEKFREQPVRPRRQRARARVRARAFPSLLSVWPTSVSRTVPCVSAMPRRALTFRPRKSISSCRSFRRWPVPRICQK